MDGALMAVMNGHGAVAQLLLERGAYVDTKAAVRLQLYKGAEANTKTVRRIVLHAAAWEGCISLVQLLLNKRADVNAKAENGRTALYLGGQKWARSGCIIAVRQEGRC
jgi:ankyrin repeat protein